MPRRETLADHSLSGAFRRYSRGDGDPGCEHTFETDEGIVLLRHNDHFDVQTNLSDPAAMAEAAAELVLSVAAFRQEPVFKTVESVMRRVVRKAMEEHRAARGNDG